MALRFIPTYTDETGNEIRFCPLSQPGYPGFTHRVIINRRSVGLLADGWKPSIKAAEFFMNENAIKTAA